MRAWLIRTLGGYTTAIEALDALRDGKTPAEKQAVLSWAVQHLFKAIAVSDLLRQNSVGNYTYLGKEVSKERMEALGDEAFRFKKGNLWLVLREEVRYQLSRKMFEEGRIDMDMVWGQLSTFMFDTMRQKINELASLHKQ